MSNQEESKKVDLSSRLIENKQNDGIQKNFGQILESITSEVGGAVKDTEETKKVGQTFQPKVGVKNTTTTETTSPLKNQTTETVTTERISELENMLRQLIAGQVSGVKVGSAPKKPAKLDFSKLSEKDVFDLNIPIEAVDHSMPDYLKVDLKDTNYVPRWVNRDPRRLGPMKANGWDFVKPDEIENSLTLAITTDENGQYRFADTVLMKCEKVEYFGQLRRNHLRALAMVDPKNAHLAAKAIIEGELTGAGNTDLNGNPIADDKTNAGDYQRYNNAGKMKIYSPEVTI
jgi:hypothetical protein